MNPLERIDYSGGRFGPKMLDIDDELTAREAELIARSHGYELTFRTEGYPASSLDCENLSEVLNEINPPQNLDGGHVLVGASDCDDGAALVLIYARPITGD